MPRACNITAQGKFAEGERHPGYAHQHTRRPSAKLTTKPADRRGRINPQRQYADAPVWRDKSWGLDDDSVYPISVPQFIVHKLNRISLLPRGGRAAFKSISRAGLAHKKVTFAGFWISHKMCVAISSIGHTEVAMSLDQSGQLKNPFPAISSSRGGSSVEGDRRTTGRGA